MCCEIYAAHARCAYDTHAQTNRSLELSHRCLLSLLSRVEKEGSREKSSRRSAHAAQGSIYPRAAKPRRASTSVAAWIIVRVESPSSPGFEGRLHSRFLRRNGRLCIYNYCSKAASTTSRSSAFQWRQQLVADEPSSTRHNTVLLCATPRCIACGETASSFRAGCLRLRVKHERI